MRVLALDIGESSVYSSIVTESGVLTNQLEAPRKKAFSNTDLEKIVKQLIDNYSDYDLLGISAPGINGIKDYYKLIDFPTKEVFEAMVSVPVLMDERTACAGIGESVFGVGKNYSNVLYLFYADIITGALIVDNELYRGNNGFAGAVAHSILYADGRVCSCGRRGCYERYASVSELVRRANFLDSNIKNGIQVVQAVESGNLAAKNILDNWISDVSHGIISFVHLFDPKVVVLSGGIFLEDYVFTRVCEYIHKQVLQPFENVKIEVSVIRGQACLLGVAHLAREKYGPKQEKIERDWLGRI